MASQSDELVLDASQLLGELAKVRAAFNDYNKSLGQTANTIVTLRETEEELVGTFRNVASSGYELAGRLKLVNEQWETSNVRIKQTTESLKALRAEQERHKAERGAVQAEVFLKGAGIGTQQKVIPGEFQSAVRSAQAQLAKALGDEPFNLKIAQSIFSELKKGVVDVEIGVREKIQKALIAVQNVQRRITEEQDKQTKSTDATTKSIQSRAAALEATNRFIQEQRLVAPEPVPGRFQNVLATAQSRLAKALGGEPANVSFAQEILANLQKGVVTYELGIREKIQKALIGVLNIQKKITEEQEKQSKAAGLAAGPTAGQLTKFRGDILGAFPVPSGASIGSVISFQAALNTLINTAARGKITFADLQTLFQNVSKNPLGDYSGGNKDLAQTQVAIQRIIQAHQAMTRSAKESEDQGKKTGRSLYVSFNEFMRLLEIQIIHRAFGALVTGMQQSVGAAADLQIKISEIRTVSQGAGIGFEQLQKTIRGLSDEFGKPQIDIAEAIYQGFSNQVLKTAADMSVLNEVLRFSKIAVTDVTTAMELYSSVMNAYGFAAFEARQITDQLFKAIELGRFRAQDIAGSFGRVSVVAADMGIKITELEGLLTVMTRRGVSAHDAMTQISSIMQGLQRPSAEMTKLFREWGVDSGAAAIQTYGFVEVLRRLTTEAQRSGSEMAALFPNVRALRGITAATQGRTGTSEFEGDVAQITASRESAANAAGIVAESAGDRFRKELTRIQNFFISDFGNNFLTQIERISASVGGLSTGFKSVGDAVLDIVGVFTQLLTVMNSLATLNGAYTIDLGTLVKIFLAYKGAVIGVSVAQTIAIGITTAYAQAKLMVQAATNAEIGSFIAYKILIATKTALIVAATVATTVYTTAKNFLTTGIIANTVALGANLIAWARMGIAYIASAIGAGITAIAVNKLTIAKIAAAIASRALTLAMAAIPFVAIGLAIAYLIGLFDPLQAKIKQVTVAVEGFQQRERNLQAQFRVEGEESTKREQESLNRFREQLNERVQLLSQALARIRQGSTALVEAQRTAVEGTTNEMKKAIDAMRQSMSDAVSKIKKEITDAETQIKHSLSQTARFADRTSTETFNRALKVAGLQPVIQSGLRPISYEEEEVERMRREGRTRAFDQQQVVIKNRINQLTREATDLSTRGDRDSMDSARRKYEEIRRLSEQMFEMQTTEAQTRATDLATDTARLTGTIVRSTFQINMEAFNRMMAEITRKEEEAEARFQASQARRKAEEEEKLKKAQEAQIAVRRAMEELQGFRVTGPQGELTERFRDPRTAMQNFQNDWQRMRAQLDAALQGAPFDPAVMIQVQIAVNAQRVELEKQVQRQILDARIAGEQQWLQEQQRSIERQRTEGAALRQQGENEQRTSLVQIQSQLTELGRNIAGSASSEAFTAASRAVDRAAAEYEGQRGQAGEAASLQRLQTRIRELAAVYRGFLLSLDNATAMRSFGRTGEAESQREMGIETIITNLQAAYERVAAGTTAVQTAETRLAALNTQITLLPANLQVAARNINDFGNAALTNQERVRNFSATVRELADQVERLGGRVGPVMPPIPAGGEVPALAGGGLLGNVFSSRGQDDTLVWAKRGEFIVNPESSRSFYTQLLAINAGRMPRYSEGGMVNSTTTGDITINVNESKTPDSTARAVLSKIQRELRRNGRNP